MEEESGVLTDEQLDEIVANEDLQTDESGAFLLTTLSLQRNNLRSLGDALRRFVNLEHLDLSRNNLDNIHGLQFLPLLKTLSLYFNKIADARKLLPLQSHPVLAELDLRLNPITRATLYRLFIIQQFTTLVVLDRRIITQGEKGRTEGEPISVMDLVLEDDEDSVGENGGGLRENTILENNVQLDRAQDIQEQNNTIQEQNNTIQEDASVDSSGGASNASDPSRENVNDAQQRNTTQEEDTTTQQRGRTSSSGGVWWRAQVADYAVVEENSDSLNGENGAKKIAPLDLLLTGLSEVINQVEQDQEWEGSVDKCKQILLQIAEERENEARAHKNEILQLRAQNERSLDQLRVRMQSSVIPRLAEADEDLLRLMEERNTLKAELDSRDGRNSVFGLTGVDDFDFDNKLKEEGRELRARLQSCEAERDALISENERLMKLVSTQRSELSRLREIIDANKQNTNHLQNGRSSPSTQEHEALPTPPQHYPAQPNGDTATLLMLKEAHDCLISSNKSLLNEISEIKQQHQNELQQWSHNFDLLKQHFQNSKQ